jgi:Secretion system C-terminal sorting domain/SprB repeat
VTATSSSSGCSSVASSTVTVLSSPISSGFGISCDNGSGNGSITAQTQTVSGGTPPYSYRWSNGATSNSITGLSAGSTYTVSIFDAAGNCPEVFTWTVRACTGAQSRVQILRRGADGRYAVVAEETPEAEKGGPDALRQRNAAARPWSVSVFPNPAAHNFTVSWPAALGVCKIEVFDALTRRVYDTEGEASAKIEVENWSPGLYFVKVRPLNDKDAAPVWVNVVVGGN